MKILKISCPRCKKKYLGEMNELFFQLSFHLAKKHRVFPKKAEEVSKNQLLKALPPKIGLMKLVK